MNLRGIAGKVIELLTMRIEQAQVGGIVTRNHLDMMPYDPKFSRFPAIWIGRGSESTQYETSENIIVDLEITVQAFVKNSTSPESAIEEIIDAIDNTMQRELTLDGVAIEIKLSSIDAPDYFDNKASVQMKYNVKYEYTAGER